MRILAIIGLSGAMLIGGCAQIKYTRADAPQMFEALDSKPNGYTGMLNTSEQFEILRTRANNMLLCRTVRVLDQENSSTREYCKIKGGEWR